MLGKTISHYRILEKLGEGGMGIVYKAYDTTLNRPVALKFLPPDFLQDKARKARLRQEAQAAAAINHPNICTVYEIDESDEQVFIAMEYLEGQNLKEIIQCGPLNINRAIEISLQIADGLEEIHKKGMVHRDIKSENVRITKKGQVKIMDFGLVKTSGVKDKISSEDSTGGTIVYMSPEQIRGEALDQRSDIWSSGVVLYEMITGQLPFKTDKPGMSVIYSILDEEPDSLQQYQPEIPPELARIVSRCLQKNPEERYQDVHDFIQDLKRAKQESLPPVPHAFSKIDRQKPTEKADTIANHPINRIAQQKGFKKKHAIMAGLSLLAIILAILLLRPFLKEQLPPMKIVPFASSPGKEWTPAFSPDGNLVAYSWSQGDENDFNIYVKMIGAVTPLKLTSRPTNCAWPAFSPDGRTIAFLQLDGEKSGIYKIPVLGGMEQQVINLDHTYIGSGLEWSRDGEYLLYSDRDTTTVPFCIYKLSLSSGESRQITFPSSEIAGDDEAAYSPDGRWIAFRRYYNHPNSAVCIIPSGGGAEKRITSDDQNIVDFSWSQDGDEIIFSSDRGGAYGFWRISCKGGEPRPIPAGIEGAQWFEVARKGSRIAYTKGGGRMVIWKGRIPDGQDQVVFTDRVIKTNQDNWMGRFSHDGRKITFSSLISGNSEIWICDSDGSNPVQLTNFDGPAAGASFWSPDNQTIAFDSRPDGNSDIFIIHPDGKGLRQMTSDPADDRIPSWSGDGRWIYFTSNRSGTYGIWKIPVSGGEPVEVFHEEGWINLESPDGKWLYYCGFGTVWRLSLENKRKELVFDSISSASWFPVTDGIYYIKESSDGDESYLLFKNFKSNSIRQLATLKQTEITCLDVSGDRSSFLYSNLDTSEFDIFILENFQ